MPLIPPKDTPAWEWGAPNANETSCQKTVILDKYPQANFYLQEVFL